MLNRLEAAARAQEVAQQEASRLERTLVSEREQRLVLEAALTQIQEQIKLQSGAVQEVYYTLLHLLHNYKNIYWSPKTYVITSTRYIYFFSFFSTKLTWEMKERGSFQLQH